MGDRTRDQVHDHAAKAPRDLGAAVGLGGKWPLPRISGGQARDLPSVGSTALCDQSFDAASVAKSRLAAEARGFAELVVEETHRQALSGPDVPHGVK